MTQVTDRLSSWWRAVLPGVVLMVAGCTTPTSEGPGDAAKPEPAPVREAVAESRPAPTRPVPYVTPGLITQVDLQRVLELQDDGKLLLVDVRPSLFYTMGHIPGAISLPRKQFDQKFPGKKPALDEAKKAKQVIVLYCQNVDCPDAYAVARKLSPMGYSVSLYKGGWEEWKMTGF